jgi:hypothetical protein
MRAIVMTVIAAGTMLAACTGGSKDMAARPAETTPTSAASVNESARGLPPQQPDLGGARPEAHADHEARYGGFVFMDGDAHLEAVLDASGAHRVYFSNAVREPLAASFASSVKVTITRPGIPNSSPWLAMRATSSGRARERRLGMPAARPGSNTRAPRGVRRIPWSSRLHRRRPGLPARRLTAMRGIVIIMSENAALQMGVIVEGRVRQPG